MNGPQMAQEPALGGGTGVHSIAELDTVLDQLDGAFEGGVVSTFARDHLVIDGGP
jgi:hypothetical protein